jgi:hypothetical protein
MVTQKLGGCLALQQIPNYKKPLCTNHSILVAKLRFVLIVSRIQFALQLVFHSKLSNLCIHKRFLHLVFFR